MLLALLSCNIPASVWTGSRNYEKRQSGFPIVRFENLTWNLPYSKNRAYRYITLADETVPR